MAWHSSTSMLNCTLPIFANAATGKEVTSPHLLLRILPTISSSHELVLALLCLAPLLRRHLFSEQGAAITVALASPLWSMAHSLTRLSSPLLGRPSRRGHTSTFPPPDIKYPAYTSSPPSPNRLTIVAITQTAIEIPSTKMNPHLRATKNPIWITAQLRYVYVQNRQETKETHQTRQNTKS
jgi:hypothetical protein